jgi:hypothetical protein
MSAHDEYFPFVVTLPCVASIAQNVALFHSKIHFINNLVISGASTLSVTTENESADYVL